MSACTCHSIREGSGGITFSDYMLGVLCGHCEGEMAEYEEQARWDAMSPQEQARERVASRWWVACDRIRNRGRRPGSPDPWGGNAPPF